MISSDRYRWRLVPKSQRFRSVVARQSTRL